MEKSIIIYNRTHFKKEYSPSMRNQDVYELLPNNAIREMFFSRTLDENDRDDEEVRRFLNLLQDKNCGRRTNHSTLTELEGEMIVKKS